MAGSFSEEAMFEAAGGGLGTLPEGVRAILRIEVLVISDDGWSWIYAWRQLGAAQIYCLPLTPRSRDQLAEVSSRINGMTIVRPPISLGHISRNLVTVELMHPSEQESNPIWKEISCPLVAIFAFPRYAGERSHREAAKRIFPTLPNWRAISSRHHRLGGLTNARVTVLWGSTGEPKFQMLPKTGTERRFGDFLETLPKDVVWKSKQPPEEFLWQPKELDAKPLRWPIDLSQVWVQVPRLFQGGEEKDVTYRKFGRKEICQLLDVRLDLAQDVVFDILKWRGGAPIPIRFLSTAVFNGVQWIAQTLDLNTSGGGEGEHCDQRFQIPGPRSNELIAATAKDEHLSWLWDPTDALDVSKAVKSDSASVDVTMWDVGGNGLIVTNAREVLRRFFHGLWRRKLTRDALRWLSTQSGRESSDGMKEAEWNIEGVRECVTRAANSTWWEWSDGSRLFFWRWPSPWQREARDGAKAYHTGFPKQRLYFPEMPITDEWIRKLDNEKMEKLIVRRYLEPTEAKDLIVTIPRARVKKGEVDIRVVWDLTRNGVNPTLYTPSFFLPTVASLCRRIQSGDYQADFDIGEQFHNFLLHPFERPLCGVRISKELVARVEGASPWMRWCRAPFGWSPSPYLTLRMLARAIEIAKGEPTEQGNPFGWKRVNVNFPGQAGYDPSKPRILLVKIDGTAAAICIAFFDDGRVFGSTEDVVQKATRQVCSRIQHLGNQDAARKRRPASQRAGAWCGGVVHTDRGLARKFVSQEKWDRTKGILRWFQDKLETGGVIDRPTFLKHRGFLVHVTLTYEQFRPFMKGFHLSAESWRSNRDMEGWPIDPEIEAAGEMGAWQIHEEDLQDPDLFEVEGEVQVHNGGVQEPITPATPDEVIPVPRLRHDVSALRFLTASETPMMVILRPILSGPLSLAYGFGDASGEGFGSFMHLEGAAPTVRAGFWCKEIAEQSSNYRELRNLVDMIQSEVDAERLMGREVWVFTDNAVAEAVFYKGGSGNKALFDLMLKLRKLTITGQFILHLVHIAGTRMIAQGTDGLSRGETYLGALLTPIQEILPLHLSPTQRHPALLQWFRTWMGVTPDVAGPAQWYHDAHKARENPWLWDLPPAGALDALEELGIARLKRHDSLLGVVAIPFLLRPEWLRRFVRTNRGIGGLSHSWHSSEGRCRRCTALVTQTDGIFCANFGKPVIGLPLCRNAWCQTCYRQRPGTSFSVWQGDDPEAALSDGEREYFQIARKGDHIVCPFECDLCAFARLRPIPYRPGNPTDERLLDYIRRANLDAFWSRAPDTVKGLHRQFVEQRAVGRGFGIDMFPRAMGPFPSDYDSGMRAAIGVLEKSNQPGRHEEKVKFSTARKVRSLHTNLFMASAVGGATAKTLRVDKNNNAITANATDTEWFSRFINGFRARVGERRKQDAAISIQLMVEMQRRMEERWQLAQRQINAQDRRAVAEFGSFIILSYCGSMRGFETVKVVLTDLRNQIFSPTDALTTGSTTPPHVSLPLMGRFKARSQEVQKRLIDITWRTDSGLQPGRWASRLVRTLEQAHVTAGWAYQDESGRQLRMTHFAEDFFDLLAEIQQERPDLVSSEMEVHTDFGLARSARRGATTRATNMRVDPDLIDWINRWNIGEEDVVHGPMRVVYSDRKQLLSKFLCFSQAL